jgi:acylphosphatase
VYRSTRVRIQGRVQGVWFRGWTVAQARALGLDGWVRNRTDGSVEAVFGGPAAAVAEMVARCHQGPSAARVACVEELPEPDPVPPGFTQRKTA